MFLKLIYMFFAGYLNIIVEGFFIERFLNICRQKEIFLKDLHRENSTYIKMKILKSDFKEIRHIAKRTKCKVKIEKKSGVPFFINRYRKRKIFAIAGMVIAIFIFILTKFIWNIEVVGNEDISEDDIKALVSEYGIEVGTLKSKINTEKISNLIRLNREDLSWIGITVKGTNVIVTVEESIEVPEIKDANEICNIIATEDSVVSKIIVRNGTAKVQVGDEVKKGDILVEGIMEGVNTGIREVHADADIFGKKIYSKELKENFVQNVKIKTGNEEEKNEICIKNFAINFNKRLSNFENYDTISTRNKIKVFSDFYLPFEIKKTTYIEYKNEQKTFSEEELISKIEKQLEEELESEFKISNYEEKYKKRNLYTNIENDGITVKLVYEVEQKIGEKDER